MNTSWIWWDGVKHLKHPPKSINIAFSLERSSRRVCKSAGCVRVLTFRQKISELQVSKGKSSNILGALCLDSTPSAQMTSDVTVCPYWGEDKLWFGHNEQIQESMYGAQQPCLGEKSVCVTPTVLGRIYSPWVYWLDQGWSTRPSMTKTK